MSPITRREISSQGGKATALAHPLTPARARAMGLRGGRPGLPESIEDAYSRGSPGFRSDARRLFAEYGAEMPPEMAGVRRAAK